MDRQAQLEWEKRTGRLAAAAAFASLIMLVAAQVVEQVLGFGDQPRTDKGRLVALADDPTPFVVAKGIGVLSYLALAGALLYLWRATRYRRKEAPGWVPPLIGIGFVLLPLAALIATVEQIDIADEFVATGVFSEEGASDALEDRGIAAFAVGSAGVLAFAISLVLVNIHTMRAGLLSRFMGSLGIIVAALYVIPLLTGPVVLQVFWTAALGFLFLDRWPGGRGPAWATGRAEPWPSRYEQAAREREPAPEPQPVPDSAPKPAAPRQRKRKKRRG